MLSPVNGQLPVQIVKAELSNGMVITAPVDLWVSTLLEIIDDDTRARWLETIVKKIQDQQKQPVLLTPNGGIVQ